MRRSGVRGGSDEVQRLRDDYEQQIRDQRELVERENAFFEKAKSQEMERHNQVMSSLEQSQSLRTGRIQENDGVYEERLRELQRRYAAKRKTLKQSYSNELRVYDRHDDYDDDDGGYMDGPDSHALIVDAVVSEVLRNREEKRSQERQGSRMQRKVGELSEELDKYIRQVRGIIRR